jgi:uncharacterized repeat protein (TIGR02059 family)
MRNTLIILLLLLSNALGATTFYISPSGSDSNNGSSSSPWKTLAYACSKVTASGDIINVAAGTYNESSQCKLVPGVSITGQGTSSIIKSSYTGSLMSGIIDASSGTGTPVNGNQSISNLLLDGNNQSNHCGISSSYRSNVTIANCTINNFADRGISIQDGGDFMNAPSYYSNNNQVHDCIITNCGHESSDFSEYAGIWWYGQTNFLLYNTTINNSAQSIGNADNMKCAYTTNSKIYNNIFTRPFTDNGGEWNFFSELFFTTGGMEIYNNTFNGNATLDLVDIRPGSVGYGMKIYNNSFILPSQYAATNHGVQAIDFEEWGAVQQVYIYGNHFKNTNTAIQFDIVGGTVLSGVTLKLINGNVSCDHIYIYCNIFENIGNTTNKYSSAIDFKPEGATNITWDQIYIDNNTMVSGGSMYSGIMCETGGTMSNLYFRNNIIQGAASSPITFSHNLTASISSVYVQKNLYYQNASNAIGYSGVTVPGLNEVAVPSANPLFVSGTNFHLQSTSPAIGAGIHITTPVITADYEGGLFNSTPEIGAFRSGSVVVTPPVPVAPVPVYQSSAIANATPTLLEMTFDITLGNIVPAATSFNVLVNSAARTVNSVVIAGTKVQLTLSSAIKFGDIVTVTYTKPATTPLQGTTGGLVASISSKSVTNNLASPPKTDPAITVTMSLSPYHVHKTLNVTLTYSITPTTTNSPKTLQITDLSGNLLNTKVIPLGATNIVIPLNLGRGIYNITTSGGTAAVVTKRFRVF